MAEIAGGIRAQIDRDHRAYATGANARELATELRAKFGLQAVDLQQIVDAITSGDSDLAQSWQPFMTMPPRSPETLPAASQGQTAREFMRTQELPVLNIGQEGRPYLTIKGMTWDAQQQTHHKGEARVSEALLRSLGTELKRYAADYARTVLEAGDPVDRGVIEGEMARVSAQVSINWFREEPDGSYVFSGSSAVSNLLPKTAFSVSVDGETGQILGFADSD